MYIMRLISVKIIKEVGVRRDNIHMFNFGNS